MRIVLFSTRFAFEYSVLLANHLYKKDEIEEVYLFLPENYVSITQLKQLDQHVSFIPFQLYDNKKVFLALNEFKRIVNKIRKINPDIIHIQGSAHPYFWLFFNKIKFIPICDTVHDAMPHPGFSNLLQTFMRVSASKKAKRWFVHGETIKKQLIDQYPDIKSSFVKVIPKGHYGIFKNYSDKFYETEEQNILFFGNITKYKGIHILIQAAEKVIEFFPNVKFVIAGRIRKKEKEEINLDYLKGNKNFELKTYRIPDKEVSELYQKATIVVLPYIEASQSGVLSIAFGLGKAVIASKVGALPEIIEHNKNGILVNPSDSEQLSDAIISILNDKKKREGLQEQALKYAKERLSWSKVADITLDTYNEILNEKK